MTGTCIVQSGIVISQQPKWKDLQRSGLGHIETDSHVTHVVDDYRVLKARKKSSFRYSEKKGEDNE